MLRCRKILRMLDVGYLSDLRFNNSIILESTLEEVEDYARDLDLSYDLITDSSEVREYIGRIEKLKFRINRLIVENQVLDNLENRYTRKLVKLVRLGLVVLIIVKKRG